MSVSGWRKAIRTVPEESAAISADVGRATRTTASAPAARSARSESSAPELA
jgi:hypothetical protein